MIDRPAGVVTGKVGRTLQQAINRVKVEGWTGEQRKGER